MILITMWELNILKLYNSSFRFKVKGDYFYYATKFWIFVNKEIVEKIRNFLYPMKIKCLKTNEIAFLNHNQFNWIFIYWISSILMLANDITDWNIVL